MAFEAVANQPYLKDILPIVGYDEKFLLVERIAWLADDVYGPYEYGDDVGAFADREVLSIETGDGYLYFIIDKEGGLGRWVKDS